MEVLRVRFSAAGIVERLRFALQPIVIFAISLVCIIWIATWQQIETERGALLRDTTQETANLTIVFEQSIARSLGDIDRLMLYLRESHERGGYKTNWPSMIKGRFTRDEQALQIAVSDASGLLVASSLGSLQSSRIDVSDRPHFLVHKRTSADQLFISKPVIGRVSGKWSIQLTRRISDEQGGFAGVIVVSLDPEYLSRAYGSVSLGVGGGLALFGADDIIRAGTGVYEKEMGSGLREGLLAANPLPSHNGTQMALETRDGQVRVVGTRPVKGYPLFVMIAGQDVANNANWRSNRRNYLAGASLLTVVVWLSMMAALRGRQRHEQQISHLARHDALTQLANRVQFAERLHAAVARATPERQTAIHMLDLDRFKLVNDTYGHPMGDQLLKRVAERMRGALRQSDLVARFGGDEFAVIQTDVTTELDADRVAARLCKVLSAPFEIDGICIEIGASIGIGIAPKDGRLVDEVVRAADLALYSAKSEGRNRHRFFNEGMNAAVEARRTLETELRVAIEQDQLEVHYQPIVDIASGTITGYEALVRWRHPKRGLVSPMEFIPLAEETGLIGQIGTRVLQEACSDIARRTRSVSVAVNFSPIQFKSPNLVEVIKAALTNSGLPPARLVVEITESTLMQTDSLTIKLLTELRELGVQIAMDDFGTGYSSLSYLHSYPINTIKIDRSFVKMLGETDRAPAIIRAITTLADSLGMSTVAEGVETRVQLEQLALLGCTKAQGYYFSPPKPASEIIPELDDVETRVSAAAA